MTLSLNKTKEAFQYIIGYLIGDGAKEGSCGINITSQFQPEIEEHLFIPQNINAAFLIALSGENHPRYSEAKEYLEEMENDPLWAKLVIFYREGISFLLEEFQGFYSSNSREAEKIEKLGEKIIKHIKTSSTSNKIQKDIWDIFHPEASNIINDKESQTKRLREKRKIKITNLNTKPIMNVPEEVLFTANALLTIPPGGKRYEDLDISPNLWNTLEGVVNEEQVFWYDHPVQIGVEPERNEIIYGLRHLSEALLYEKKSKNIPDNAELSCVLSASVTHEGLQGIVKEYIEYELEKAHDLPGLKVYLFTEAETGKLIHEILVPAAKKYLDNIKNPAAMLREVVGVDGRYGRHYSFLKAIAAFWQIFISPKTRATFKIDLDQVFPQKDLLKETGKTAFQHLMSPLWGAEGVDSEGNPVYLGMIAGALVNEKDITSSLFTPDVTCPLPPFKGEDEVFCSKVPQAISTISEMMTRYTDKGFGDNNHCISRIHVTGGTTGIMIDALRKYRPFTPIFIGRAEDQAYLLSVLFHEDNEPALRYLHKDGLLMRHDKEAFVSYSIKAAAIGKIVGDYERILFFTYYARSLPWDVETIKREIDPFTGSFVSSLPLNIAYLRLALKAATFFETKKEEDNYKALELIETGSKRIRDAINEISIKDGSRLRTKYEREKVAWHLYYDILDRLEEALNEGNTFAVELKEKAKKLVDKARVVTGVTS